MRAMTGRIAPDAGSGGGTIRLPAIRRFIQKCMHDPSHGCILWMGGTSSSRGGNARSGQFWFEGKMWKAHRWAALHIHGLEIDSREVIQTCGNSLCVQHLESRTYNEMQSKQYWLMVQKGYEQLPPEEIKEAPEIPFFVKPGWLTEGSPADDEPPF
jgi:hypothetical protein